MAERKPGLHEDRGTREEWEAGHGHVKGAIGTIPSGGGNYETVSRISRARDGPRGIRHYQNAAGNIGFEGHSWTQRPAGTGSGRVGQTNRKVE